MHTVVDLSQSDPILLNIPLISKDKITEKIVYTKNAVYSILNYGKEGLCYNDISNGLYRSVILSYPERNVICYSPPKTQDVSEFIKKYPLSLKTPYVYINEIIEGVMINLFYDTRVSCWDISTKSGVSGKYSYNKDKNINNNKETFLKLFLDALRTTENESLNDIELVKYLPKDMCYSFVLQHPRNKICLDIKEPRVYLVAVYSIKNPINKIPYISLINPQSYKNWHIFKSSLNAVWFPTEIDKNKNINDIMSEERTMLGNINKRGVMITDLKTGEMYEIKNTGYLNTFKRRNPHTDLLYKFLCILRLDKLKDYLKYYPLEKKIMNRQAAHFNEFISNVYNSYVMKYILKQDVIISEAYNNHIYKLHHDVYLPSRRRNRERQNITIGAVREYFIKYEPRVLYSML